MAVEDALFRVMVPVADALARNARGAGGPFDPSAIVEATLQAFAQSVAVDDYLVALRQRLLAHLEAAHDARDDDGGHHALSMTRAPAAPRASGQPADASMSTKAK